MSPRRREAVMATEGALMRFLWECVTCNDALAPISFGQVIQAAGVS
jgi:hypothetical protein